MTSTKKIELLLQRSMEDEHLHGAVSLDLRLEMSPRCRRPAKNGATSGVVDHRPGEAFSCNYCHRKFFSSQALGGHQNAHKLERTLAKRSRDDAAAAAPHSSSPATPAITAVHWLDGGHQFWAYRAAAESTTARTAAVLGWADHAKMANGGGWNGEAAELDLSLKL